MTLSMHKRAIHWTLGVAALIGSVTAIGAMSNTASAATTLKISGLIWSDTNANNTREAGELGAAGKRVVVTSADPGRSFWASRTTGTSGWWGVPLPAGCYTIKYDFPGRLGTLKLDSTDPFDLDPGVGSPMPGTAGYVANLADTLTHTARVCVTSANETTYASIPPNEWHRLILRTWHDNDRDGVRESGEPGVTDVSSSPRLWAPHDWDDNPKRYFPTKTPDSTGLTTWWVPAGTCGTIVQQLPATPSYGHTKSNIGSDSTDSDFVNATPGPIFCVGRTDVTLGSGLINLSRQPQPDALKVVGRVWVDNNRNGRQDAGEPNAPDGMRVSNAFSNGDTSCQETGGVVTSSGRYELTIGHTINCRGPLPTRMWDNEGDTTGPATTVGLIWPTQVGWIPTIANVGSDSGDSDGYFNGFESSPPSDCGGGRITCADIPATGSGPITIDFGIVKR